MHSLTFVIINDNTNIEHQVANVLDPFWEGLAVERYRRYFDREDVASMAKHYNTQDLHALAERMEDWTGSPGGLDGRDLYYDTTDNPDGRWDWYEIGGRWDRHIPHSRRNVIRTRTLAKAPYLAKCLPCSLVASDGTWFEDEHAGLGRPTTREEKQREQVWLHRVKDTLAACPDDFVACVDVHN